MKRKPEESFEEYKKRRSNDSELTKIYLRGRLFWNSHDWGTYRKKDKKK